MPLGAMPLGAFGEVVGTTGTLQFLGPEAQAYKSKVIAPRNPKLLKSEELEHEVTPSRYLFDMKMTTEQKLANTHVMRVPKKVELLDMADTSLQKREDGKLKFLSTVVNVDEPMFQPFPSEVYFQNFEPFETYEVPLVLRNNDKVPRLIKVTQTESPYFHIISPHDVGHKVGPGLPTTFKIQFTPDEKKDYSHELICITEREKFLVPVHAIGARAILDFPDEIHFPVCPVKYPNTRTLLIRNIGNKDAKFNLSVEKPFTVTPEIGVLLVNECTQVTVEFKATKTGDHRANMVLHYDTGEDVLIGLYGATQDANVRLEKNSIRIENTFISMANQRTLTINNRSDVIAHFRWTEYPTEEEEEEQKARSCGDIENEEKTDTDRFLEECVDDPTLRDKLSILKRTFKNRRQQVDGDPLLYTDDVVKIEPVEGDIWPNSSFEVSVIFKPREAKTYTRTAFCDITGRESRLPLRVRGDGEGPKLHFSFEKLDMGNIFIGSTHYYEVVLANKGDIDAIYSVMPSTSIFGPCLSFNPAEGIVMPAGHQAIQIAFSSPYLGDFEEEFSFQIDGTSEQLKLVFTGSVIGPTFQFDVPKLRFGTVSYGFLNTKTCTLQNTSLVPMTFNLRVPADGIAESICSTSDIDSSRSEMVSNLPPREFEISPSSGTIQPQSQVDVTINFISNTIKKYDMSLVVDVERVGEEILTLPITAKCIVPAITALNPVMDYGRCFLRHPYEKCVRLHNDTDLPAKYELIPVQDPESAPILYTSSKPKGIVDPHSVLDVPLSIEVQTSEEQDMVANFNIFGSSEPPLAVHIACIGEGPVVHIAPLDIDWGLIPVLTDKSRNLLLANESLIPAKFTAHMVRANSVFRVEPQQGEIDPESAMEVTVTAKLDDAVRFQDKLQINFIESQVRYIPLTGYGEGTTIVSDPPLSPQLNLGPNFSNRPLSKIFHLTNNGRRHQQLVWSTEGFSATAKAKKELAAYNPLDMKFKNKSPPPQPAKPIFKLTPNRFDLPPGSSIDMKLEGFVQNPQLIQEKLVCHAIIGRQGGKELIMKVNITSDFISPLLEFSTKSVFFRVDKQSNDDLELQYRELIMSNVSSLPLTTSLKLEEPFQIISSDGTECSETEVHLDVEETYTLKIQFDPSFKDDSHIRTIDEVLHITYKEHPHIDYIALRGEVYFPNLEFEKSVIDFGCILNDTEVTRYINITNNSPMEVKYKWSFLIGNEPCTAINRRPKSVLGEVQEVEEVAENEDKEAAEQVELVIEECTDDAHLELPVDDTEENKPEVNENGEIIIKKDEPDDLPEDDNRFAEENIILVDNAEDSEEELEKGQLEQRETPEKEAESLRLSISSQLSLREEEALRTNPTLAALLEKVDEVNTIGIEEVFDILPLYGTLQPGDTEQVTLTFYGHADIWGDARAMCEVEGGPTYEINLKGEASLVEYKFDCKEIDYGKQMYDQVSSAEITLINTGRVGFDFRALHLNPTMTKKPPPGTPVMVPYSGYVDPFSEQKIVIKYMPGIPEEFNKSFKIQVAHFEPDVISICGEGTFPRVSLDLPRLPDDEGQFATMMAAVKERLAAKMRKADTERPPSAGGFGHIQRDSQRTAHQAPVEAGPSDFELQLELERMAVRKFADEQHSIALAEVDTPPNSDESRETSDMKKGKKKTKLKPKLPEYLLDFGFVVLGTVRTHIVRATNTGYYPVSFQVERDYLHHYGFHVELDRVRNLPGAPDHETVDFEVSFDPRGANLQLGPVEVLVPVNVLNGPLIVMRLKAHVTMPDMEISDDTLDFADVNCGECKVITVQLHNHQQVKCEWNSSPTEKDRRRIDKHMPMHLRRKMKQEKLKPSHFEIMPPTGTLLPGQRINVQVKFMPTEEKFYEQRIPIRIAQSSQRILLLCRGQGLEPRLEFEHNLIEFGPILPHSGGDEQDIVVRNPCSFPVEFYSLEFDNNYLEEEKVLRLMRGYDEYNTILLPPRHPGEKLPHELTDYYDEQRRKLEEAEAKKEAEEMAEALRREQEEKEAAEAGDNLEDDEIKGREEGDAIKIDINSQSGATTPAVQHTTEMSEGVKQEEMDEEDKLRETASTDGVGELEITPVSASIARHLGIDLTSEGKAARNRRGLAMILHGAPMSGKTTAAVMLAKKYEAALLTVDGVVMDAISIGNTPSGLRARELCAEEARNRMAELRAIEGEDPEKKTVGGLSVEAVIAHTQGAGQPLPATHSQISNRKTSTISELKGKDKHHGSLLAGKPGANATSMDGVTASQVPTSPPPLAAPISRRLSVSASVAGEEGLMSCVLPEDLLVEILAERLQLNDCHRGVIFDGLETLFSQNMFTASTAILKALNNRRFIFFVTLKLDYNVLKEQEKKCQEEKEIEALKKEWEDKVRLEEMSEDEYDAMTEDEKAEIDKKRLSVKKERIKREMEEKAEKERREREEEEERRKIEEENKAKRKGKKGQQQDTSKDGKKNTAAGKTTTTSQSNVAKQQTKPHDSDHGASKAGSVTDRPDSHQTERSETMLDDAKKKKQAKDGKKPDGKEKSDKSKDADGTDKTDEMTKDPIKEAEILLMQRFRTFEHTSKDINELMEFWDRTVLAVKRPHTPSEKSDEDGQGHPPSGKKGKGKDKHDKEKEKEKERLKQLEREAAEKAAKEAALAAQEGGDDRDKEAAEVDKQKDDDGIGIPHIIVDCSDKSIIPGQVLLDNEKLPTNEEVLDGLGLGRRGPPIPPPASFSVVPYPVKRRAPPVAEFGGHYMFVASSPDDPNIGVDEKAKDTEIEEEKSVTPDKGKDDHTTPTRGRGKDKSSKTGGDSKERKKSAEKKGVKGMSRKNSMQIASPPPGAPTPISDLDAQSITGDGLAITESKTPKLSIFSWVVPANSEVILRLRFQSEELGLFDQTLNFEIVGTRRRYQLYCRGVCAFPSISREPRIVFNHRKKTKKADEIVHKKYVLTSEIFEFGPLLVGKSRDKFKEGKYPENMEKMKIMNTSPLEADISICFLNDSKGETYLLDPPNMLLKPGESQELTVWAYPKVPGHYEDAIVCCIRENPEPVVLKICCDGFRPELELDKKQLHFDKVLLHRKDTKTVYLRNSTHLPVAWRLNGLENLGDDFTVAADSGVVEPKSEYALHAYFRAMKPTQTSKKMIRLEVSDVDNIMGVVHTEPIQVIAEAYDVALDMSFPKGTDGGLDFGTIRVMDETKQTCTLKNKGKYEIAYSFMFEDNDPANPGVTELFSVIPQKGSLAPMDRPTQVQVIFKSQNEITVKDVPILKCQVIEPNIAEGGEIIASIPVKVSVKSVFSKYQIVPTHDINFGSLLVNSKKSRTFVIENRGEFDFKYTITKMVKEPVHQHSQIRQPRPPVKGDKRSKSRDGSSSGRSIVKARRAESIRQDAGASQSRLQLGMFTVFPAFNIIMPGNTQTITIDCVAEQQGRGDEDVSIDISDRDPTDHPSGIPYKMIAEACIPSINIDDIGSIFEEHRVVKSLSVWQHSNQLEETGCGVFAEDERKFVFTNVIVGRKAQARFKITNINKVPCDVNFTLKPISTKQTNKHLEIFEVDPPRAQIPNHSYVYATVTFTPPSMQNYSAIFEASIEGVTQNQAKGKSLIFEITGEGNLPRISIQKPTVRNKRGQPLLLFKKILLGQSESLPLVLINDGNLPSKVDIDLIDPDRSFSLRSTGDTRAIMNQVDYEDDKKRPHTASVVVNTNETASFDVIFRPSTVQRTQGHVRLSVADNQYEDSIIQMVGEGYEDEITLDNIHSIEVPVEPENEVGSNADDDVQAAKPNLINFGDCYINEPRTLTFTLTNHSKTDCVRFQWPDNPDMKFSPQIGHLHGGCSKDISATFKCDQTKTLTEQPVLCKVMKITFDKPADQVSDWDDRIRTVKWVDIPLTIPQGSDGGNKSRPTTPHRPRPAKKKVIETEPEPAFNEVADTTRNVELLVSAVSDFTKFSCKTEAVHFKETLMFQTRVYKVTMQNKGQVNMDYSWQVVMENFTPVFHRQVTFFSEGERPESRVGLEESNYIPFTVTPMFGSIPAGKKETFEVKFSPLDANDYEGRLVCSVPNLEQTQQGPVVGVKGTGIMPYCHFELEDSNYITGARRNPEMRGPGGAPPGSTLDPNTRVLEFNSVGVGVRSERKFGVVNPTNQPFSFEWICEDDIDPKKPPCFDCIIKKGVIKSGKKFEVGFEFISNQNDIIESFWRFVIPEQNISVPFLLVGSTKEPMIMMDRSHLNFKALLIGHEACSVVHLINNEDQPFQFHFLEDSCHSAGFAAHIRVEPMSGEVGANSRIPINLYFSPNSDKEVNFNLVCKIHKRLMPVTLNVKAEGYSMNVALLCSDSNDHLVELADDGWNRLVFGEVEVNEQSIRNMFIMNSGKFNFDYKWELHAPGLKKDVLTISPSEGGVVHGEKQKCALTFCPTSRLSLAGCALSLKISNGPSYNIALEGLGVTPGLHLSFPTYNFGSVFIFRPGMPIHSKVLKITNKDKKNISIDCLYESNNYLHHNFEACILAPGESADVTFTFYPREARKYHETVTFEINGLSKQSVEILGMGTEMKVEVADPKQKIINLGSKVVGDTVKRHIPIVNNSPAPVTFSLALTPTCPALQQRDILQISPLTPITLPAKGGSTKIEVIFAPKSRISQFTEEVMLECAGLFQPLFVLQGQCLGMEISLDTSAIPFGAVVQRSQSTRKLVMTNTGDMNAKFRWNAQKFAPDFSINPTSGYITPGMTVTFEVTFHPQDVNQDIRYDKLRCYLEGGPHKPVTLTLTGMCIGIPPVKEVQNFSTHVRGKDVKNLSINNKTNQIWKLKPIIDGEFWTGAVTFVIEPQQTKQYELVYKPLTMTPEGKKHQGSVFFPMPDGSGMVYNLTGIADPPKPNGKITRDVPCKTSYTESLSVQNWLKKPQRFRVKIEPIKPDKLDPGTTVKGMEYIDVPGSAKKDFKLTFYAHREGATTLKVTFVNEQNGEYQFYEVNFRATRPGVITTIDLSTPVRQSIPYMIKLENPLSFAITFSATCTVPEILMPNQLNVPPNSEGSLNFEYQPLKAGDTQGRLEVNSNDLGLYQYDLNLKATPACSEKPLYFRVCLGQNQTQVAKFFNFAKQKTDYVCKIDNPDFHVDKTVAAAPGSAGGTEVALDILFEPSQLGEQRACLSVSSPIGGEYTFPLFGTCISPKPQGPFTVKAGSTTSITFRNVFSSSTAFTFQVDNPSFHLAKQGEMIRSHKDHRVVVGFDGNDSGSKSAVMGKLVITCPRSAGGSSAIQWVYYLKGISP